MEDDDDYGEFALDFDDNVGENPDEIESCSEDEDKEEDEQEDVDETIGGDPEVLNTWGVKTKCPLNVLKAFHCVKGFPPDLMHDWLEGCLAEDLLGVIRTLSWKRWFTVEDYNSALHKFRWYSYESSDKPQSVPLSNKVALKMHEITERITATEFLEYEIDLLDECVIEYLDMRKQLRSEFPEFFKRPKPKHHFMRRNVT